MKLRIPRRIKVEEESSESESEAAAATIASSSSAPQDPAKDKVPVVTTKATTTVSATLSENGEMIQT